MAPEKCRYCGIILSPGVKICPNCGKKQGWTLAEKSVVGFILLIVVGAAINSGNNHMAVPTAQDLFNRMTSEQHLSLAKKALTFGHVDEARKHIEAIKTGSPEYSEAQSLVPEVIKRKREIAMTSKIPATAQTAGSQTISPSEILPLVKLKFRWSKGGFDSVMLADFTIDNQSTQDIKDIEITCTHYGKSGTAIDSNTRTIYDIVKAKRKKRFNQFNMGFIHPQANSSSCAVTDLKVD